MLLLMLLAAEVELELLLLAATTAPASATKELVEELIMLHVALVPVGVLPLLLAFDAFLAVLVVHRLLLRVAQDLVGVRDFLELLLCALGVVLVLVRV